MKLKLLSIDTPDIPMSTDMLHISMILHHDAISNNVAFKGFGSCTFTFSFLGSVRIEQNLARFLILKSLMKYELTKSADIWTYGYIHDCHSAVCCGPLNIFQTKHTF